MEIGRRALIFDADDTLWENNLLFERAIGDFIAWLAHPTLDRQQIRAIFDDIELANTASYGYGSKVFLRSLGDCFQRLRERPADAGEQREISAFAAAIVQHRVELMPEVAALLDDLGRRHNLYLLTKGDIDEQQRKIDASGLSTHFRRIAIVAEKDVETYCRIIDEWQLAPNSTWMIGNSPKSDIIPARNAGLNAVFIPNPNTWALEEAALDPGDDAVLRLSSLADLTLHF